VREFALVLDDKFQVHEADATGTTVRLHLDGATDASGASRMLQSAVAAVDAFAQRYGPYPFDELDIVQTELASALGVSWSGVIFMQANGIAAVLRQPDSLVEQMQFTLVHEIGHQWWGNMIGVNSNDHAFMNESLTNYLTTVAFEDMFGRETGLALLERSLAGVYLAQLAESGDGVVDLPIEQVDSLTSYSRLVYGKGALGFLAIRLEIGDEAFFRALDLYVQTQAFQLAAPTDLRAAFEETSGRGLDDLWWFWFDASGTTSTDVEILLGLAAAA
jgi:aminopeptidase N